MRKSLKNGASDLPKSRPGGSKIDARRLQNRSRRPFGAHLGQMPYQRSLSNTKKTARKCPRAPKRGPRPAQTLPKWSPRPSQINFLSNLFARIFHIENLHRFFAAVLQNLHVFSRADLQNSCAHAVFRGPPHRLTFFKKITRNHPKIFPKSFPNPSQNLEKSIQNRKKSLQKRKIT